MRKEQVILLFASAAIRDRVLLELKECIEFASAGECLPKTSSIDQDLMSAHQCILLQNTPSLPYRRLMVHLNLTEMASRLLEPRQTCIDRASILGVVVALPHTESHRQLVASTARCLAAAPVLRQGIVTILWRRHQCRSLAACRTLFLLLKPRFNKVVAGHRQHTMLARARHIQYANLLNAKTWIAVRLDHHASQSVSLPGLLIICGADLLRP